MSEHVLCESRDAVTILTINAPEARNAIGREVRAALLPLLEEAYADKSVRALVLTGAGEHFCSGGNLNDMKAERTLDVSRDIVAGGGRLARALIAGPKPLIAAVEGYAVGAGFSLALGADYTVASSNAAFIAAFGKVGILPDMGMLWSLRQRVGLGKAKHIIASARKVQAQEAFELGIVDQLAEPGQTLETAISVAKEFTNGAPLPYTIMKQAYARGVNSLEDALDIELQGQPALYLTNDHREAVAAFLEKRTPVFEGS